ncbi:MAG: hypothetical protein FWF88_02390 [Peptococcaceae bacterium]|nr:hypothetical protein [Peptococcaceae bacterium]
MTQKDRQLYTMLIVVIFGLFLIISVGHFRTEQLIKDIVVAERLEGVLKQTVPQIDIERLKLLIDNPGDPYVQELRNSLGAIRNENSMDGLYLVTKTDVEGGKEPWIFLLDSRPPGDPLSIPDRSFMRDVPAYIVEMAHWGHTMVGHGYSTKRGEKIGGFASIGYGHSLEIGPSGEYLSAAVLVAEYDMSQESRFIYQTLYIQCGILFLGALLIFLIGRRILKDLFA